MRRLAMWAFRVEGELAPKGSVSSFVVRERESKKLRAVTTHTRQSRASEQAIKLAARAHMERNAAALAAVESFYEFPVELILVCRFDPPKWVLQRRKGNRNRPAYEPLHKTSPDGDKLMRTVADALKGVAFQDDRQVLDGRFLKLYGAGGDAHAVVHVAYYPKEVLPEDIRTWIGGGSQ